MSWFVCTKYDPVEKVVVRDFVRCRRLQDALDTLMPGHVEQGWRVWEEVEAPRQGITVVSVWFPEIVWTGDGPWDFSVSGRRVYPGYQDGFTFRG